MLGYSVLFVQSLNCCQGFLGAHPASYASRAFGSLSEDYLPCPFQFVYGHLAFPDLCLILPNLAYNPRLNLFFGSHGWVVPHPNKGLNI